MSDIETTDTELKRQARELVLRLSQVFEATRSGPHPFPDLALSAREVDVMIFLGDRGETIMTDLASAIDIPVSTLTRVVDRLERKGLVTRSRSERDRRLVVVSASEKGALLHGTAREHQHAAAYRMLGPLSKGEREIFLELMAKVGGAIHSAGR